MNKKTIILIIIVILLLIGVYFLFFSSKSIFKNKGLTNKTKPYVLTEEEIANLNQPLHPINEKERAGGFKIGSVPGYYPKFISGWLDPKKPNIGENQQISIKIKDPDGIKNVSLEIVGDRGATILKKMHLQLVKGDEKEGTWQGNWQVHGADSKFRTKFIAENTKGKINNLIYFIFLAPK